MHPGPIIAANKNILTHSLYLIEINKQRTELFSGSCQPGTAVFGISLKQLPMGAITKGRMKAVFTAAQIQCPCLLGHKGQRLKASTRMRAVAQRLLLASAAAAPPIGLASLNLNGIGTGFGNDGFFLHLDSSTSFDRYLKKMLNHKESQESFARFLA
jgi:hypothetical protein